MMLMKHNCTGNHLRPAAAVVNPDEMETQPLMAGQNYADTSSSVKCLRVQLPDPGCLDCDMLESLMNAERPLVDYRDQYRAQFKARLRAKSAGGLLVEWVACKMLLDFLERASA